jgi:hypothetical protein
VKEQSTQANYTIPLEQVRRLLERVDEQGRALFRELHLPGGEVFDLGGGVSWSAPAVTVIVPVTPPTEGRGLGR